MTTHYLSVAGVAKHLGIAISTATTYLRDKRLPEPDAIIGEAPAHKYGWLPETIDEWHAARPGKGGRPPKRQD